MEREGVLSVHQGKEVELLCRASGDDPISISWRKGGRDLVAQPGRSYWGKGPYSSARQKLNTIGTLQLRQVKISVVQTSCITQVARFRNFFWHV